MIWGYCMYLYNRDGTPVQHMLIHSVHLICGGPSNEVICNNGKVTPTTPEAFGLPDR